MPGPHVGSFDKIADGAGFCHQEACDNVWFHSFLMVAAVVGVTVSPKKRCQVQTPGTCEQALIWTSGFADTIKLMRSYLVRLGPKPVAGVL